MTPETTRGFAVPLKVGECAEETIVGDTGWEFRSVALESWVGCFGCVRSMHCGQSSWMWKYTPMQKLTTVAEQDKQWEQRGNNAFLYDTTYVRHWDVWQGKK